jgi:predicted methyltransferase
MPRRDQRSRFTGVVRAAFAGITIGVLAACSTPAADMGPAAAERFRSVVESPVRTDEDRRLDPARKPAEFLAFTGVKPSMQVLDVSAGAGYTSELLALVVGDGGRVWAQRPSPGAALTRRLQEHPQRNIAVVIEPFDDPVPPNAPKLDLITLVLNYHDITYLPVDRDRMLQNLYGALQPGGHFVVIDHSAKAGAPIGSGKTLHRIDEAIVVAEVKRAGFVLEAEGDFLRNPADTREESSVDTKITTDRFALRFVKP